MSPPDGVGTRVPDLDRTGGTADWASACAEGDDHVREPDRPKGAVELI